MDEPSPGRSTPLLVKLLLGCCLLVALGVGLGALLLDQAAASRRDQSRQDALAAIQRLLAAEAPSDSEYQEWIRLVTRGSFADSYEVGAAPLEAIRAQVGQPVTQVRELAWRERVGKPVPTGFELTVELTLEDGGRAPWTFSFDYHDLPLARVVFLSAARAGE